MTIASEQRKARQAIAAIDGKLAAAEYLAAGKARIERISEQREARLARDAVIIMPKPRKTRK